MTWLAELIRCWFSYFPLTAPSTAPLLEDSRLG